MDNNYKFVYFCMSVATTTMCRGRVGCKKANSYCGNGPALSSYAEAYDMHKRSTNSFVRQTMCCHSSAPAECLRVKSVVSFSFPEGAGICAVHRKSGVIYGEPALLLLV